MLLITKDTKQEEISAFKDRGGDNTVLSIPKMTDDAKIYIRGTGNILGDRGRFLVHPTAPDSPAPRGARPG